MAREANPPEVRVLRALRQVDAITGQQMQDAFVLLEATEPCTKCGGTGRLGEEPSNPCDRCEGTGEQRVIR